MSFDRASVTPNEVMPKERPLASESPQPGIRRLADEGIGADSAEQRRAEQYLIAAAADRLGAPLKKVRLRIHDTSVEVDGYAPSPPTLVEAWAHHGRPKPAQKHKVMTDALKLSWIAAVHFPDGAQKVIIAANADAAAHFRGKSWMASALRHLGVEVVVIPLPEPLRSAVLRAQRRQHQGLTQQIAGSGPSRGRAASEAGSRAMISGVSSVTRGKRSRFPYRPDVHRRLIDAAASGRLITYGELGTGRGWVGTYLYRIAHEEDAAGRPPLTAIVIQKATGEPGPGMRDALEQVGYSRQGEDASSLWRRAISDVFRFWRGKTAAEALASWRPQLGDSPDTWPRIRQPRAR